MSALTALSVTIKRIVPGLMGHPPHNRIGDCFSLSWEGEDSGYKSAQNGDDWLHFGYNLGRNGGEKGGRGTSVYFPYQKALISGTCDKIGSKAPVFSFEARGWLEESNG